MGNKGWWITVPRVWAHKENGVWSEKVDWIERKTWDPPARWPAGAMPIVRGCRKTANA